MRRPRPPTEFRGRWFGPRVRDPIAPWLERAAESVRAADARYSTAEAFDIPSGATDALPFLAAGYDAVSITCVDPEIGAPLNYHHPSDTPENLDPVQFAITVDFVEALAAEIWKD